MRRGIIIGIILFFGLVYGLDVDLSSPDSVYDFNGSGLIEVGDVNGDGYPDLLLCVEDTWRHLDRDISPGLYVFYGSSDGLDVSSGPDLHIYPPDSDGSQPMGTGFCGSLYVKDVNGDGRDDVFIGLMNGPKYSTYGSGDSAKYVIGYLLTELPEEDGPVSTSGGDLLPGSYLFLSHVFLGVGVFPRFSSSGSIVFVSLPVYYFDEMYQNVGLVYLGLPSNSIFDLDSGWDYVLSLSAEDTGKRVSSPYLSLYSYLGDDYLVYSQPRYSGKSLFYGKVYYIPIDSLSLGNIYDVEELSGVYKYSSSVGMSYYGYGFGVDGNLSYYCVPGLGYCRVEYPPIVSNNFSVYSEGSCSGSIECFGSDISPGYNLSYYTVSYYSGNRGYVYDVELDNSHHEPLITFLGENGYNISEVRMFKSGDEYYFFILGKDRVKTNSGYFDVGRIYQVVRDKCVFNHRPEGFGSGLVGSPTNLSILSPVYVGGPVICNITAYDPDMGDVLSFDVWLSDRDSCSLRDLSGDISPCVLNYTHISCVMGVNCSNILWEGLSSLPSGYSSDKVYCKAYNLCDDCQSCDPSIGTAEAPVLSGAPCVNLSDVFLSSSSYRDVFGRYEFNRSTGVIRFIDDSVLCRDYYNMSVGGYPGKIVVDGVHLDLNGSVLDFGSGAEVGASLLGPGEGSYLRLDSGEVSDGSLLLLSGDEDYGMVWVNRSGVLHDLEMNVSGTGVLGHNVSLNMYNVMGTVIGSDMWDGHNLVRLEGLTYQDVSFRNVSVRFVRGVKGYHSGFQIHGVYNSNVSFSDVLFIGSGYHGNTPTDSYPEFGIFCSGVRDSYVELSDVLGVNISGYGLRVLGSWDSRYNLSNVMFIGSGYNSASTSPGDSPLGYGISIGVRGEGNEYYLSNVSVCWSGSSDIGLGGNSTPVISSGVMCDLSNPSICEKGCGCLSSSLSDMLSSDLLSLSSGSGLDLSSVSPPDWWYVSPAHNKLLGSGGLVSWIPGVGERSSPSSSPSDTYVISSPGVYKLCSDRYTSHTNIIINSPDVVLDCGGKEVGVKTKISSPPISLLISGNNISVINCSLVPLPFISSIYRNGYSLYVNGSGDDVSIISSELGYDVKLENSGDVKFEDVEFTSPGSRRSRITFNSSGDVEVSDSRFDVGEIDLYSGDVRFEDVDFELSNRININFSSSNHPTVQFISSQFDTSMGQQIQMYGYDLTLPVYAISLKNESSISMPSSVSSSGGSVSFENFHLSHPEYNPFVFYVVDCNLTVSNSSLYYIQLEGNSFSFVNSSYIEEIFLKDTSKLNSVNSKFCNVSLGRGNDLFLTGTYQINNIYNLTPEYNLTVGRLDYNYDPIYNRPITCGVVLFDNGSMCKLTPGHYGWFYFVYDYKNPVDYRIDPLSSDPDLDDSGCNSLLTLNGYSGVPNCPEVTPEILSLYNLDNPCPFEYHLSGDPYKCREHIDYWRGWFEKYGLELPRELSSSSSSPT